MSILFSECLRLSVVKVLYNHAYMRYKGHAQIDQLCLALEQMNRYDVADIIRQRHQENAELTVDCFTMSAVDDRATTADTSHHIPSATSPPFDNEFVVG